MKPELYDKSILQHQDEVNKQGYFEITNIDADLFETQVNLSRIIQTQCQSQLKSFFRD